MTSKKAAGDLHDERSDYQCDELNRSDMHQNPFTMFGNWLQNALDSNIRDATAMSLATASANGSPSVRIVLLKQYDESGLCWYTSYDSRKGRELASNPKAALLLYWRELERQIRIEGHVEKTSDQQSINYFNSRPAGSKFSAAASPQSDVVPNQSWLVNKTRALQLKFTEESITRPANWGGYRLKPEVFEFWQGRPSRLHDRFRYSLATTGEWTMDRLAP
ncbi:pyridoxamine 5'-phosphate oxidase [Chromatiales bacterium (ex Bugula neritina AB1)]|nr:pyridoxamine 5'-phosphate oxidase [Chromatiales bacterium (ex Bugula neritina AB1)]